MVNAARISATQNAVSARAARAAPRAGMTISGYCSRIAKLVETAFSCSEM